MKIVYTDHARERMALRGITERIVQLALSEPDIREVGRGETLLALKKFDEGIIKVVYVKEVLTVIITTVWHKKNI